MIKSCSYYYNKLHVENIFVKLSLLKAFCIGVTLKRLLNLHHNTTQVLHFLGCENKTPKENASHKEKPCGAEMRARKSRIKKFYLIGLWGELFSLSLFSFLSFSLSFPSLPPSFFLSLSLSIVKLLSNLQIGGNKKAPKLQNGGNPNWRKE